MSEDLERRLREAGHRLAGPDPQDTLAARARVLAAAPGARGRRRLPRRAVVLAFATAVVVAGAFGVGYAVAAGGTKTVTKTRTVTKTKVVKAPLDAGPGFLPAVGWDSVAGGTAAGATMAVAANVPLDARDRQLLGPPEETAKRLGPNGVLFYAMVGPADPAEKLPQKLLPLQLGDAKPVSGFEGMPPVGSTLRLQARVAAYDVDALVFFGAAHPSAGVLAAAREELGRLAAPSCPDARPVAAADVAAAKAYVLGWLPAHYPGDAGDVVGATATAAAGKDMPRHGEAAFDCGASVAANTVEVDVTLPVVAKVSASLSELTYFVAKTSAGWQVWERAR